jgi:hypothetical protein
MSFPGKCGNRINSFTEKLTVLGKFSPDYPVMLGHITGNYIFLSEK